MCSKMVIDGFDYYVTNCEIKGGDYLIDDNMMFGQAMGNDKEQFEDCFKVGFDGKEKRLYQSNYDYNSPTEAYEAAITYILNNLL